MRLARTGYALHGPRAMECAAGLAIVVAASAFAACTPVSRIPEATLGVPERSATSLAAPPGATAPLQPVGAPWQPRAGQTWQWQLAGDIDTSIEADIYDLDLFETPAATVSLLHSLGRRAICYMSAGSFEAWRPDANAYPSEVIGRAYLGWPDEWWLDIRRVDGLAPILEARLDLCRAKGFDGVEPDNIDGYLAETGFPLSAQDQLGFNRWLARAAHLRGLSIGLKNDPEQARELADDFDWALLEDCFAQGWCEDLAPFVTRGRLVIAVEYTDTGVDWAEACLQARRLGIEAVLKNRELDAWRQSCPPGE